MGKGGTRSIGVRILCLVNLYTLNCLHFDCKLSDVTDRQQLELSKRNLTDRNASDLQRTQHQGWD